MEVLFYVVGALLFVLITRVIFSIPEFLAVQKAKLKLMAKMAKQQGVSADEVDAIMTKAGKSFFDKLK